MAVRKPKVKKHLVARKKAQESVVFAIVFIFLPLLRIFCPYGIFFESNKQKFEKQEKKFDRQVFACKTLSLADSSSVANDVQRRVKKVTPLLLLGD
jgi:hypothetical protein